MSILRAIIAEAALLLAWGFAASALHVWRDPNYQWRRERALQRIEDGREVARWLRGRGA